MKQNYFVADGKKYYTGTVFIVKNGSYNMEATFICYDSDRDRYVYKTKGGPGYNPCTHHTDPKTFKRELISVTNRIDSNAHMPVTKTMRDGDINGLFVGWVWYIFLMVISTIFKSATIMWIFISIAFFAWRKKKIEEEGTYIEW